MIPKTIHYCWFGGNPLPKLAMKCINSWKKYFPDYTIIEWNEHNYDISKIPYIAEAYKAKKYAFVSDYARFDILYQCGGLYFDTDVEVIKPFDDILSHGPFMGCEIDGGEKEINVAPGLGIAASPGLGIYKHIIDFYATQHFLKDDGSIKACRIPRTNPVQYDQLLLHVQQLPAHDAERMDRDRQKTAGQNDGGLIHVMVDVCHGRDTGFHTCQDNGTGRVYCENGAQSSAAGDGFGTEYAGFYCSIPA